jgi:hypothetical protein
MEQLATQFPHIPEDELLNTLISFNMDLHSTIQHFQQYPNPDPIRSADESKHDQLIEPTHTQSNSHIVTTYRPLHHLHHLHPSLLFPGTWTECKRFAQHNGRTILLLFADPSNYAISHIFKLFNDDTISEIIKANFTLFITEFDLRQEMPTLMQWYKCPSMESQLLFCHPLTAAKMASIDLPNYITIQRLTVDDWVERLMHYHPEQMPHMNALWPLLQASAAI